MALTWAEARTRSADLTVIGHAVDLDLSAPAAERFTSRTTVRFTSTGSRDETSSLLDQRRRVSGQRSISSTASLADDGQPFVKP